MDIALPVTLYHRLIRQLLCGFLFISWYLSASVGFAQKSINLPFFDDFSTASGRPGLDKPDSTRWQPGSGVYINNTMSINQPTINVATFDGLKANGLPYTQNNQLDQDYTDTLASLPINLAGLTASDSVYFSFYYQAKGLGEAPDAGSSSITLVPRADTTVAKYDTLIVVSQAADSLTLQFLGSDNVWRNVWTAAGGTANTNFVQPFLRISNPLYFHANFAFRFRSFGRRSGPFDTWNIDYIYLNKGRTLTNILINDIAARQAFSPYLKRYTAMPLSQYIVNPAGETADSVRTDINNLGTFNFTTFYFSVRDLVSGTVIQRDPQTPSLLIQATSSQRKAIKIQPVTNLGNATKATLRYQFYLDTSNPNVPTPVQPIPGVNLYQNDTISAQTVLDDYYAYDDGTWEYAAQIGPSERIAIRFVLNKPDVVSGIRASIVPIKTNQTGQPFVISVYGNVQGRPGPIIYQKAFVTQYPTYRNGFVNFPFDQGVSIKDTFYVGYQQISSSDTTTLHLGFDKNSPFGSNIFYNGGSSWSQNFTASALNFPGAFMLRPVVGGLPAVITATTDPEPLAPLQAYPNPTSGLIRWESQRLTRLDVLGLSGRLLHTLEPSRGQQTLDLSYLPDGMYLLRLIEGERVVVQKLIVQH